MRKTTKAVYYILALSIVLAACKGMTKTQKGAIIGTAGGAAVGAVIAGQVLGPDLAGVGREAADKSGRGPGHLDQERLVEARIAEAVAEEHGLRVRAIVGLGEHGQARERQRGRQNSFDRLGHQGFSAGGRLATDPRAYGCGWLRIETRPEPAHKRQRHMAAWAWRRGLCAGRRSRDNGRHGHHPQRRDAPARHPALRAAVAPGRGPARSARRGRGQRRDRAAQPPPDARPVRWRPRRDRACAWRGLMACPAAGPAGSAAVR